MSIAFTRSRILQSLRSQSDRVNVVRASDQIKAQSDANVQYSCQVQVNIQSARCQCQCPCPYHIIVQFSSFFFWSLRLNFSLPFCAFDPPRRSSSRRSLAFGKLWAVIKSVGIQDARTVVHLLAALSYHLFASSKLRGHPMPTSVK